MHPSYASIYAAVRQIPPGRVATYGQIADLAGRPRQARQVGYALAVAPDNLVIPWHRVINAQGRVSGRGETGRATLQRGLLEAEGVAFDEAGRVDLRQLRWPYDGGAAEETAG